MPQPLTCASAVASLMTCIMVNEQTNKQGSRHASLLEVVSEGSSLLGGNEPYNKLVRGVFGG